MLAFGDSLQIPWRSIGGQLVNRLRNQLGFSGYSLSAQSPDLAFPQYSGGATEIQADADWWMPSYRIPSGGELH